MGRIIHVTSGNVYIHNDTVTWIAYSSVTKSLSLLFLFGSYGR